MRELGDLIQLYKDLQGKKMQERIGITLTRRRSQSQFKIDQLQSWRYLVEDQKDMIESIDFHIDQLNKECAEIEKIKIPIPTAHYRLSDILDTLEQKRKEIPKGFKGGMIG